jgi:hypothetical protein
MIYSLFQIFIYFLKKKLVFIVFNEELNIQLFYEILNINNA